MVVDYNVNPPKVVYVSKGLSEAAVKIKRIPIGIEHVTKKEGEQIEVTKYKLQTYLVIVVGKDYYGAKFVHINPKKPLVQMHVEVPIYHDIKNKKVMSTAGKDLGRFQYSNGVYYSVSSSSEDDAYLETAVVHSVPGVTAEWHMPLYGSIAYDTYVKDDWTDIWQKSGKEYATSYIGGGIRASNGEKKIVTAHVYYRLNSYEVCSSLWCKTVYVLKPTKITGLYPNNAGDENPSSHPLYAEYWSKYSGSNNFTVGFTESEDNGGSYLDTEVSMSFNGIVSFSGTISSYRQSDPSGPRPYVMVTVNGWKMDRLYYWGTDSAERNLYEVYLSWN